MVEILNKTKGTYNFMKYYCYDNYSADLSMRNLQIVYLYYVEDLKPSQIAEIVGLATTTVTNYRTKYSDKIGEAEELFTSTPPKKSYDIDYDYSNRIFADTVDTNKFYLLEVVKLGTNELICSKIGTTTRKLKTRITEIYKDYSEKYGNIQINIKRVYNCEDIVPEAFESHFRALYIIKYGKRFVKNDRFMDIEFDYKEADKIFTKFLDEAKKVALI